MPAEGTLLELKRRIKELLPADVSVTGVEFEGPELVLYTEDTQRFVDDGALVRTLAKELKKRISVRPSSDILMDPEKASKAIHKIIPEEGGITDIYFDMESTSKNKKSIKRTSYFVYLLSTYFFLFFLCYDHYFHPFT